MPEIGYVKLEQIKGRVSVDKGTIVERYGSSDYIFARTVFLCAHTYMHAGNFDLFPLEYCQYRGFFTGFRVFRKPTLTTPPPIARAPRIILRNGVPAVLSVT